MALADEIIKHFQLASIKPTEDVLSKCVEMCTNYNIDAEDFVDQWFAYTASNLNGDLPSVDALDKMERKEFQKQSKELTFKKSHTTPKSKIPFSPVTNEPNVSSPTSRADATPKSKASSLPTNHGQQVTPQRRIIEQNNTTTYDSTISDAVTYSNRKDALSVVCSYGLTASFRRQCNMDLTVTLGTEYLPADAKYMYELMAVKATCLQEMTKWIAQNILKKHNIEWTGKSLKDYTGEITTYGRICPELGGKLNAQCILLEESVKLSQGHSERLTVNKLPKLALFPGHVVAVSGNKIKGSGFIVDDIYTDATPELPSTPPQIDAPLEIVIAAGPFTLQSNLQYEPLQDLIKYVMEHKPHILLLVGPFLEPTHEGVNNGELRVSYDTFFEQLIEGVATTLANTEVKIVVVSSQKEAQHHCVYPTPPYAIREQYPNVMFVPDPSILNVNGMLIGVTSADVLFHLGKEELFFDKTGSSMDRIARLVSHILQQQCFYPLYPPDKDRNVDHDLLEQYGMIEVRPHMLILPSNFRHFVKKVNECLVINPERLTKGFVAGSFARIEISPGTSRSICNRVAAQVLRI